MSTPSPGRHELPGDYSLRKQDDNTWWLQHLGMDYLRIEASVPCGRGGSIDQEIADFAAALSRARAEAMEDAAKKADLWAETKPDLERSTNEQMARLIATIISDTAAKIAAAIRALSQSPRPESEVETVSLREANKARQAEWDGDNQITPTYRATELAGELGEACNIIKKLERERLGIRGSRATVPQLAEELADIVICADLIAMGYDIDLNAAIRDKFNATSEKVGLKTRMAPRSEAGSAGAPRAIIEALRGLIDAVRTRARIDGPPARAIVDALRNADTALHSPRPKEE